MLQFAQNVKAYLCHTTDAVQLDKLELAIDEKRGGSLVA